MALAIANNVSSLTAQHNLAKSSRSLTRSIERLSSGFKVNRGADGPAALVISEKQRAQIAGLRQAIDNSEKAVSLVQTAEGALNEINNLLVGIRGLGLDSANSGVNDEDALAANQAEITNALETIDRIANNTQFGTKKLLDGSAGINGVVSDSDVSFLRATKDTSTGSHSVEVTTAGERATLTASTGQTTTLAANETLTINGVNVTLEAGLTQLQVVDRINEFSGQTGATAEVDSGSTRLYSAQFGKNAEISVISNLAAGTDTSGFANSEQEDEGVDIVAEFAGTEFTGTGNVVSANAGPTKGLSVSIAEDGSDATKTSTGALGTVTVTDNSMVFQIGPNQNQTVEIAVTKANPGSLGLGVSDNQFANLNQIDVTSAAKAQDSLAIIDSAIDDITNLRGELGAFQKNTLEAGTNNLRATLENTVNAESVIRDTDFAEEIAEFTKQQVLTQAGTSVLSSANQTSQLVLSLLG